MSTIVLPNTYPYEKQRIFGKDGLADRKLPVCNERSVLPSSPEKQEAVSFVGRVHRSSPYCPVLQKQLSTQAASEIRFSLDLHDSDAYWSYQQPNDYEGMSMNDLLLNPIRKTRISEQVAEQLEALIRQRKLEVGEQLPSERKLMLMLGVGRGAVREALRILEIKGFIETRQGVGAFVHDFEGDIRLPLSLWLSDQREVLANFFEIRFILEPNAAGLAAKRITPTEVVELRRIHNAFRCCVEEDNLPRAILVDADFHRHIARATQNKLLSLTMETLNKSVIEGWKASLRVPGRSMKTVDEHEAILQALESGDSHQAAAVMRKHLRDAAMELREQGLVIDTDENA